MALKKLPWEDMVEKSPLEGRVPMNEDGTSFYFHGIVTSEITPSRGAGCQLPPNERPGFMKSFLDDLTNYLLVSDLPFWVPQNGTEIKSPWKGKCLHSRDCPAKGAENGACRYICYFLDSTASHLIAGAESLCCQRCLESQQGKGKKDPQEGVKYTWAVHQHCQQCHPGVWLKSVYTISVINYPSNF
ncbi:hypothetical protein DV515_00005801 [Chloebia gouldiae]|uniref:Uncharacterized protein n=1 Tax=Chloebia gouldiae TaxID=44316 RepID=A0A3L8SMC7_CHLGU|nr:hypothetical protein DV515_00005801 [Chloebia gouldiae]